jgi:hypothetical protein
MKMTLTQFISKNNLRPADAVEMVCPNAGFPKHYAVYLGYRDGMPKFFANITDGVQILSNERLAEFVQKYQVTNIERFAGSHQQRLAAVRRAIKRVGEKAYNLVFNNCEHFKNWVLHGKEISKQAFSIGGGAAVAGLSTLLLGIAMKNNGLKKTGSIILIILLVIIFIAFALLHHKQSQEEN